MATGQHGASYRPEEVANWAADTLDAGFGDGMGLAMKALGTAAQMLMADQSRVRPSLWQTDEHFGDDRMVVTPVIGE